MRLIFFHTNPRSFGVPCIFFTVLHLHKETTCFSPTIGGDGSRQCTSDAGVFVRVFCNLVLVLVMVEHFSHKSSIVSLLSVNPFSFPFSTNLHKENAHVFLPLLATTGAASIPQYRRFSFGFYTIRPCFSLHFGKENRKTRTKTGDTEQYWRLPSPPIVGEKHVHFLLYTL